MLTPQTVRMALWATASLASILSAGILFGAGSRLATVFASVMVAMAFNALILTALLYLFITDSVDMHSVAYNTALVLDAAVMMVVSVAVLLSLTIIKRNGGINA